MQIPENLQIDSILSRRVWNLVQRHCDGAWNSLKDKWTVSFDEVVEEAKRRGLESFVVSKPHAEGFWLVESENDYEVFYVERCVRAHGQKFSDLEAAFIHWLDQEMSSCQLPRNTSPNEAFQRTLEDSRR